MGHGKQHGFDGVRRFKIRMKIYAHFGFFLFLCTFKLALDRELLP